MSEPKLVDIECKIRIDNPDKKAIAVADGTMEYHPNPKNKSKREKLFWLPRSLIEINDDGTVTMPEWLAQREGLI
jgi:hypothetical protein